jgi:hypothetical protein
VSTLARPASSPQVAPRLASATHRLQRMMRQRELLRPMFASAWDHLAARFEPDAL